MTDPYTPDRMDAPGTDQDDARFDALHADAKAALGTAANGLRVVRDRYRAAYLEELGRWHDRRATLRPEADEAVVARLGTHQQELAKLELVQQVLERTWLFLERGDASLLGDPTDPDRTGDPRMLVVEAQEAERSRLAQEIHDGPAQTLTNAIFQVEYMERVLERDGRLAGTELRFLRELLRRQLGDIRTFISQLRPPLLDQRGLDDAIRDAAEGIAGASGLPIAVSLEAPVDGLDETARVVALRVAQEALQNVRKHAGASTASVETRLDDGAWVLEVRDDGRGFDPSAVAEHGRRSFGLRFMRERAELVGAHLEVRSRPDGGTVVRLAIPVGGENER
jgi:two-component system sensor histidine kinase DegS